MRLDGGETSRGAADRVAALLARTPVYDAHLDALQRAVDLGHDLGRRTRGHFDLERAAEGGLGAVVLVCWVDPDYLPDGARERASALIDAGHALARRCPDQLLLARTGADLDAAHREGRIAGLLGIEGGHAIEEDLAVLGDFHARGLRVMTLVWNNHLAWIRSCQTCSDPAIPAGISDFGAQVIRRMNALGMVVDLSHAGEQSFYDVLAVTSQPVMASHSGCRALHDHPRNLTDDQLRALAANGGVVGIVFHPGFLDADAHAEEQRVRATREYRAVEGTNPTDRHLRHGELMAREAVPLAIDRVVDHVVHALEVAGPQHVGLGSDFDGIERGPAGLEDATGYPRLAAALLARGLDDDTVAGVMGGNLRRLFASVMDSATEV